MCGIFGYIGNRTDVTQMIFDGLKTLEYRGYDSWGIAIKIKNSESKIQNGESSGIAVEKHIGKLPEKILNSEFSTLNSNIGIGHTRWATHGGVTVTNAHPHLDCTGQIAVIHNGIVENFQELKDELLEKGHVFKSETDTEVIAHLLEEELKKNSNIETRISKQIQNEKNSKRFENLNLENSDIVSDFGFSASDLSFKEAMRHTFNRLTGLNAIVALNTQSNEIIAAKNGSPLLVGIGENELFLASDAVGIIKYTKNVIFLEDHQMVVLNDKVKLYTLPNGQEIDPVINKLDWNFTEAEKGEYPHFLLKEIYEQPKVVEQIALTYQEQTKQLAELIKNAFGTFMVGCGTASYAAFAGTYLFSNIAKKHVNFTIGSEFKYLEDYLTPKTLLIPISQSGETIDVIEPVQKAKRKGTQIAAIVNVLGSTLYRLADHKVLLGAGQEKAVVATKSFMAMFSILLMTAYTLVGKQKEAQDLLIKAGENIKKMLNDDDIDKIKDLAKELKTKEHMYVLGRGLAYATAMEAAIKIKETAYVHAECFAGGELKHGPIALIDKGTPCIILAPNDETYNEIISNAQEVKARGGFIIGIGPKNNAVFDRFFATEDIHEATLLPQIAIAQLFAYQLALARGIKDPDKPRNLAKSVTVK